MNFGRACFSVMVVIATACGSTAGSSPDGGTSSSGGTQDGGDPNGDAQTGDGSTPPPPPPPPPCTLGPITTKVATLAGCDTSGAADGARAVGRFNNPTNVLLAPDGTTYVADHDNSLLRAVDAAGATRTIIKQTTFKRPFGLALAPGGKLYVQTDDDDKGEHTTASGTVWLVDPAAQSATVIARDLGRPRGLLPLADGRVVLVDSVHHVLTFLDPTNGSVSPLAGTVDAPDHVNDTGAVARFNQPYDVVLLSDGDLVVADELNHRLRRVTLAGVVSDYAGSGAVGNDDGAIATATFDSPRGLALVGTTLYVSDVTRRVVRKIDAGQVTTIAGTGTAGFSDGDDPLAAQFYGLEGIDANATQIVLADGNGGDDSDHHHIRVIHLN